MRTLKQHWAKLTVAIGASVALATLFVHALAWGQPPGLSITLTGTNQVKLTLTNSTPGGAYEIYWEEFLGSNSSLTNGAWMDVYNGAVGETNFVLNVGDLWSGFFRAVNTNDFDGDGIPNYQDARPFDHSIGLLRVTIESPANGSNVQ